MSQLNTRFLPGRLGDAGLNLRDDPRADKRMLAAMEARGLLEPIPALPIDAESTIDELLAFCAENEAVYEEMNEEAMRNLPPVLGVSKETRTIKGVDDNDIILYIHRPGNISGPLPGILHLHGGGMVLMSAAGSLYDRWRCELAASGLLVVGVEFRNAAGKLGPHPYPAGLNDCCSALYWMADNATDLNISGVIVSGESGGGNFSLATCLKANLDKRVDTISGVYAQCPMISNKYQNKDSALPSLFENDDFGLNCAMMGALSKVYDPTGNNQTNPLTWPLHAQQNELIGLPSHFVSVCQLDPLRDEGLAYTSKLVAAGVTASSRTINGVTHAADMIYRMEMPDVYLSSIGDIKRFAEFVCTGD